MTMREIKMRGEERSRKDRVCLDEGTFENRAELRDEVGFVLQFRPGFRPISPVSTATRRSTRDLALHTLAIPQLCCRYPTLKGGKKLVFTRGRIDFEQELRGAVIS